MYKDRNPNFINGSFIINLTNKDSEMKDLQGILFFYFRRRKLHKSEIVNPCSTFPFFFVFLCVLGSSWRVFFATNHKDGKVRKVWKMSVHYLNFINQKSLILVRHSLFFLRVSLCFRVFVVCFFHHQPQRWEGSQSWKVI